MAMSSPLMMGSRLQAELSLTSRVLRLVILELAKLSITSWTPTKS